MKYTCIIVALLAIAVALTGCRDNRNPKYEPEACESELVLNGIITIDVNYLDDYNCTIPFTNDSYDPNIIEITTENYTIITEEPNHLIVEVWDTDVWWAFTGLVEGVSISSLKRVEITKPYTIKIHEQNHLLVIEKE